MANVNDYLNQLNALLTAETAKIAQESTLEDSIIALITATKAANDALQAQVIALTPDPAVQDQINALFAANDQALDANVAKLTAAVPAGTPAEPTARKK
jgi:hypothetical protein